jgi:regulation of enolase protein 1 (concanavalin A-like superfamily)
VTLTSVQPPSEQYEQAGLGWYLDGKLAFKFVKERIDGKVYVFPGKKEMDAATVQLRLVVRAGKVTAQYRPDAKGDFQTAFAADAPQSGKARAQIGLMCFHGPKDSEHWIRFDDFRIVRLSE